MDTVQLIRLLTRLGILITALLSWSSVIADENSLRNRYQEIRSQLADNLYGIPVYIISNSADKTMQGEVYGTLNYPFQITKRALSSPNNWCDIAPQHLNIKACTYRYQNNHCQLTFYSGRKFYEPPDDAYQLQYRFQQLVSEPDYLQLSLNAEAGPMGTRDYHIEVKAIPIEDGKTFLYFRYAYRYNFVTEMGMDLYLATLGRNKIGFSITGNDDQGKPVNIGGIRGIIERNAVRYYLAIQSFLDNFHQPEEKQLEARLDRWFDLTEQHHRQLYEMSKDDYLKFKQMERKDQLRLQQELDTKTTTEQCRQVTQPSPP